MLNLKKYSLIIIMTFIFAAISFYGLGDITAVQSSFKTVANESTVVDFGSEVPIDRVMFYNGLGYGTVNIETSVDGENYSPMTTIDKKSNGEEQYCFTWYEKSVVANARFVKITPLDDDIQMIELGFLKGKNLIPLTVTSGNRELFDEQSLVPTYPGYKNSMYFDEIYHARTAYEHLHKIWPYENTHPPLGKLIIALGIKIFGMTPFGWRFFGTLFGVMLIPLMYIFAKKLFKRNDLALLGAFLIGIDFMRFAHSRIATIDIYVVFFIVLMYYFMYDFYSLKLNEATLWRQLRPLLLCGISTGLACAAKWIGIYAIAGIAILFFIKIIRTCLEDRSFIKRALTICGFCFIFFIALPFSIYYAVYTPILALPNSYNFLKWQEIMLSYHKNAKEPHSFSSYWWQWPIMYRPIYMFATAQGDYRSSISSFGNPAVWYAAIPAFGATVAYCFEKGHGKKALFIVIAFLSQFVPWMFITRTTFIYHYFASVPFLIFAILFCCQFIKRKIWIIFAIFAAILFCLYYPYISGAFVHYSIAPYLRLMKTWVLQS